MKDERFGRIIKHRSIVDLQQTLKNVRFTKIQHTFKRWTIYEDRIADLSKRLKDESRGHTNHHVSERVKVRQNVSKRLKARQMSSSETQGKSVGSGEKVVSLAAVFSIVTGALRDDTKNGCEGD